MSPRLADYLKHIRQAAQRAQIYVENMELQEFLDDEFVQDAVIGEAAARIMDKYPEFVSSHPDTPWKSMRNMRNRMAHGYFDINHELLWETVNHALPDMLATLPVMNPDD